MRIIPIVLITAAACRPTTPAAETVPVPVPVPEPLDQPPAAPSLYEHTADLDGDGTPDSIWLTSKDVDAKVGRTEEDERINIRFSACTDECTGTLHVGTQTYDLELRSGYFGGLGIHVIDIDTSDARKELLLVQRGGDSEDPPYLFWVGLYDGKALRVHKLWNSYGYNSGTATPDGTGGLKVEYAECPDAFTTVYRLEGLELVAGPRKTKRIEDPDNCAACPRVFVRDGDELVYKGEILRDFRGEAARGLQALSLGRHNGPVTVVIREDKPEYTYIDQIYARVDGVTVSPNECGTDKRAYCDADGADEVLRPGESLVLTFDAPHSTLELWAAGHYVPCYTCRP